MIKQELVQFKEELKSCAYCHDQCMASSPEVVASSDQTLVRSRIAILLRLIEAGDWEWDQQSADLLYYAFNDGLAYYYCIFGVKGDLHTEPYFRAARAEAIAKGFMPAFVKEAAESFEKNRNVFGYTDALPPAVKTTGDAPLFVYEAASLAKAPASVAAGKKLMHGAGECAVASCGYYEYDLGLLEAADIAAKAAAAAIESAAGSGPIVTLDPVTAYAIKEWFPAWGVEISNPVMTLTEYLAANADSLSFKACDKTVIFHDDWAQARMLMDSDSPRALLAAVPGLSVVEAVNIKEKASTDGPLSVYPDDDLAAEIAAIRVNELTATGADIILTASSSGYTNLSRVKCEKPVMCLCEFLADLI